MGRILVIPNSDFSQNRIVKIDITKQVEDTVDSKTSISYNSSIISLKNNNQ